MTWLRVILWLTGSAYAAAFLLGLILQVALTGTPGPLGALVLGGGHLTLFTLPIAALTAGALLVARRRGMSTPRSRILLPPAGALAGLAVALVAARGLIVLGLAFGLVTGACCLVLHLLLFPAARRTG